MISRNLFVMTMFSAMSILFSSCGDKNYTCSGFDLDQNSAMMSILLFPESKETYSFASKIDTVQMTKQEVYFSQPYVETYSRGINFGPKVAPACVSSYNEIYSFDVDPQRQIQTSIFIFEGEGEPPIGDITYGVSPEGGFGFSLFQPVVEDLLIEKVTIEDTDYINVIDLDLSFRLSSSNGDNIVSRIIIKPNVGLVGFTLNDNYYKTISN